LSEPSRSLAAPALLHHRPSSSRKREPALGLDPRDPVRTGAAAPAECRPPTAAIRAQPQPRPTPSPAERGEGWGGGFSKRYPRAHRPILGCFHLPAADGIANERFAGGDRVAWWSHHARPKIRPAGLPQQSEPPPNATTDFVRARPTAGAPAHAGARGPPLSETSGPERVRGSGPGGGAARAGRCGIG